MEILLNGTVFKSYNLKNKNHSETQKSFEENLQNETQKAYQTSINFSENRAKTVFTDPINGKKVSVNLENRTILKLENNFGIDNITKDESGNIHLSGEAQNFVSAWFTDIAYIREFLKADINQDGKLSQFEYSNTKNGFSILQSLNFKKNSLEVINEVFESYIKSNSQNNMYRYEDSIISIDDELNHTLNMDSNFDGEITLEEYYNISSSKNEKIVDEIKAQWITSKYFEKLLPSNIVESLVYNYFQEALNYALDSMEKKESINSDNWQDIRAKNHLKYDEEKGLQINLDNSYNIGKIKKKHKDSHLAENLAQFIFMMIQAEAGINEKGSEEEITKQ
ncbi:hypothetical protein ACNSOO_10535 [Aliarcobacter lanthieri]|uniref:hypothetical protein n=1 Tax=Aliarcobacter lanthieri TaxID=1355374 RepID=UPI003AAC606A